MFKEFKGYFRLFLFVIINPKKFITALVVIITKGPREFKRRIKLNYRRSNFLGIAADQYKKWYRKNHLTRRDLKLQKKKAKKYKYQPKISIIIPTFNTQIDFLHQCLKSVMSQTYSNFEICIADDGSKNEIIKNIIRQYAKKDKRIKYLFRKTSGGISAASNTALKLATGIFVGFLDHDDILWPNALFEVVKVLNDNRKLDFIYSDEELLSEDGKVHFNPSFKPDWSPDFLRTANYIVHFTLIRRTLVKNLGGFRSVFDGAQDWDLFLRATRGTKRIFHIPKILYSWRVSKTSTASEGKSKKIKSYAFKNQEKVLLDDLAARGYKGNVFPTRLLGIWRMQYEIRKNPLISIVIPTCDQYEYINNCLYSILKQTTYKNFEIIIMDTGSKNKKVHYLYEILRKKYKKIKVFYWEKEFNFSEVCNYGALKSLGEYLLFLNNDTVVETPEWLERILEHAQRKEVGAVGCKLLFPNNTIQHAGVILGMRDVKGNKLVAGHAFRGMIDHHPDTHLIDSIRNYSAVTAACLLISRKKFYEVKGFNPKFRIAFNDVDFCLKLLNKGYVNVYTPFSVLRHFESVTVGQIGEKRRDKNEFKKEVELMYKKWGKFLENDPQYNINLTRHCEDFGIGP